MREREKKEGGREKREIETRHAANCIQTADPSEELVKFRPFLDVGSPNDARTTRFLRRYVANVIRMYISKSRIRL